MARIGASKIIIYRYDGTPIRTYYGSTSNYLLSSGVESYSYVYTVTNLEAGTSYYAEVTIIAGDATPELDEPWVRELHAQYIEFCKKEPEGMVEAFLAAKW